MKYWQFLLFVGLSLQCDTAHAETGLAQSAPVKQHLMGLSAAEASMLLIKLKEAQSSLKTGDMQYFELLAGSVASFEAAKISPREAFLAVPFDEVWRIRRVRSDNRLWQPYKLSYAPKGLGQLYWDIEVVLGSSGNIERVLMVYKVPAPS
jgi:hypothetical protein